jgi:hypothetical protein
VRAVKIAWWLRPWQYVRDLQDTVEDWAADCARLDRANAALVRKTEDQNGIIATLRAELQQAYAAQMPSASAAPMEPEFCLVGIPRPDGTKRLMASRSLAGTSLSLPADPAAQPRWRIAAFMDNMLVIDGETYGETLDKLMHIWANWAREGRALPSGNRELPKGKGS